MSYNKILLLLMAALASVLVLSCTESMPIVDAPYIPENKDETDTTIPDMPDTTEGYFISIEVQKTVKMFYQGIIGKNLKTSLLHSGGRTARRT